jgi:hypothetical protein
VRGPSRIAAAPISQIAVIDVLERIGSIRPDLLEGQGTWAGHRGELDHFQ